MILSLNRNSLEIRAADLTAKGIFIGTSSWKYPGWNGMPYDESRYVYRGKFAKSRFEKNCLSELLQAAWSFDGEIWGYSIV